MTFTLSPGELALLVRTVEVLLSPHDFPNTLAWRTEAARLVQSLIGNDSTLFTLPEDPEPLCCWSAPHDLIPRGLEFVGHDPMDRFIDSYGSRTWSQRGILACFPGGRAFYESTDIYHGYFVPCKILDAIGVIGGAAGGMPENPTLMCYGARRNARFAGDRGVWLLRFLWAPLTSGWAAWHATAEARQTLGAAVDSLESGLAVFTGDGLLVHQNRRLTEWLRRDRSGVLGTTTRKVAAAVSASRIGPGDSPVCRLVEAEVGRFRVNGANGRTPFGREDAVVVVVTRESTPERGADPRALRLRFALTFAEARVAVLMAEGHRNDEIAAVLNVSPHTVRHQTERVLRKLGLESRAQVAGTLRRRLGGPE